MAALQAVKDELATTKALLRERDATIAQQKVEIERLQRRIAAIIMTGAWLWQTTTGLLLTGSQSW